MTLSTILLIVKFLYQACSSISLGHPPSILCLLCLLWPMNALDARHCLLIIGLDNQAVNGVLEHKSVFTLLRERVNLSAGRSCPA